VEKTYAISIPGKVPLEGGGFKPIYFGKYLREFQIKKYPT
jgi:hypothetical protein